MNASDCYRAGKLQDAIQAQVAAVKADPLDPGKRMFLFELLAFAGDLDRARRHLDTVQPDDVQLAASVQTYRQLLDAEQARRRLFKGGEAPQFFGQPAEHVLVRLEALDRLRADKPAEAKELLRRADEAVPALAGRLNDKPFDSLRDGDDLFGDVLEVMARGAYYWVPLGQVDSLALNAPKYARDVLYFPARLTLRDGQTGEVFLPALYPGAHEHADDAVKLGRVTDWFSEPGGPTLGVGARTFLAGEDAVGLLEWRQLVLD
jgi:type VI secretion system protein ImpE